jgi:Domain of unknown function (DUF4336)
VYAGVFAQKFTDAQVWLQPGQYSVPVNLPATFLGFPQGCTHTIPLSIQEAPQEWKENFEFHTLGPFISRDGAFGETVFYHPSIKSLIVNRYGCGSLEDVPATYDYDPSPLLYHARDTAAVAYHLYRLRAGVGDF